MTVKLKQGDRVKWKVGRGQTTGKVTETITESTTVKGNQIAASKNKPRYLVENDNTGKVSIHKAKNLSLIEDDEFSDKQQKICQDFQQAVNMNASEIKQWLKTEESHSVGQKNKQGKIKGRKSGKKIIKILQKHRSEYSKKDFQHMKKTVGYVHRHLAQKPTQNLAKTPWRYSLMNWGHDPLKQG
jgi:hypothetical protein